MSGIFGENETKSECGPFIACGAAAVSLTHEPGQVTSLEKMAAAIVRLLKGEAFSKKAPAARANREAMPKQTLHHASL